MIRCPVPEPQFDMSRSDSQVCAAILAKQFGAFMRLSEKKSGDKKGSGMAEAGSSPLDRKFAFAGSRSVVTNSASGKLIFSPLDSAENGRPAQRGRKAAPDDPPHTWPPWKG